MYWILLIVCAEATKVAVIIPNSMQLYRFDELAEFLKMTTGDVYFVRALGEALIEVEDFQPDWVIDYSTTAFELEVHKTELGPYTSIVYAKRDIEPNSDNCFGLKEPLTVWRDLAAQIAEYFGWEKALAVISSEFPLQFEDPLFTQISAREDWQKDYIDNLVARVVRNEGLRVVFLMAGRSLTDALLTSLAKYRMNAGFAYVLLGTNCQFNVSLFPSGLLCIALKGSETAKDATEVEYWYILYALTNIRLTHWTISNLQEGKLHLVGEIVENTVTLKSPVVFPNNFTTVSASKPLELVIGLTSMKSLVFINNQQSAYSALDDFPLSTKNFNIQIKELDECASLNSKTGGYPCISEVNQKKVIILLANDASPEILNILEWQFSTNLRTPFINISNSNFKLNSATNFPNYVQLTQGVPYILLHFSLILRSFKYTKVNLFAESFFDASASSFVLDIFTKSHIEIETPTELRGFNSTDPEYCTRVAAYIKESSIRPVLIFILTPNMLRCLLPAFKAKDLKAGEFTVIGIYDTYRSLALSAQPDQLEELDFVKGMLNISWDAFINSLGQKVKAVLETKLTTLRWNDCFIYDSMALALIAVDFAIRRGLNFYDWEDMMKAVRSVRLHGCSGQIAFSIDSNYRKDLDTAVFQTQNIEGQLVDVKVMSASLTKSPLIRSVADMVWADGTSDLPSIYRLNYKFCPFPEEYRKNSQESLRLTRQIVFGLFGVASVAALGSSIVLRKVKMAPVIEKVLLSTQDMLVLAFTYSEVAFIALIGPRQGPINLLTANWFGNVLDYIDLSGGRFIAILSTVLSVFFIGLFTTIFSALRKFKPLSCDLQLLAVFIARPLFAFIVYLLFTAFKCTEGVKENESISLEDSFMDVDCYEQCWQGRHLKLVFASVFVFIGFVVVSIPLSPGLSNTLEGLQFETNPRYLLLRMPVLTLFVALNISKLSIILHEFLHLGVLTLYTIACFSMNVFAVSTLDLLHKLLLVSLVALTACSFLLWEVYSSYWVMLLIALNALAGIFSVGYIRYRSLPKHLKSAVKIDTQQMFNFAFRIHKDQTELPPTKELNLSRVIITY